MGNNGFIIVAATAIVTGPLPRSTFTAIATRHGTKRPRVVEVSSDCDTEVVNESIGLKERGKEREGSEKSRRESV